jgi:hypothetical protein
MRAPAALIHFYNIGGKSFPPMAEGRHAAGFLG